MIMMKIFNYSLVESMSCIAYKISRNKKGISNKNGIM